MKHLAQKIMYKLNYLRPGRGLQPVYCVNFCSKDTSVRHLTLQGTVLDKDVTLVNGQTMLNLK